MSNQYQRVCTDLMIEFLEVAFNNILYSRKLYPSEAFTEKKIYSTASHFCQHPEVNEYLKNVLKAIKIMVASDPDTGVTVNFTIFDDQKVPIEKYVFNIYTAENGRPLEEDPYFFKTEDHIRAICLKLCMATSYLTLLPDNSSFTVEVESSQGAYVALTNKDTFQNFPWMLRERGSVVNLDSALLPLTCVKSESLGIECYILKNKVPS
ncbi:mitotic spindle assembly checkpoint protein MAD2B isoform X2 [Venturia canescens]|uniref:mitotic spindle assembly checkpoint protein MAD2B isoform X2 n=1 Tax=Venturia canescens TaxID=32260 RepID=UPI001C9D5473|nr:mitotic spindle assembly checkpoint protein MAD2B-like isoform X2 [Venturia canescens]